MIQVICSTCKKTWEKEGYGGGIPSHSNCEDCQQKMQAAIVEGRRTGTDPAILIEKILSVLPGETPEPAPIPMNARSTENAD